MTVTFHIFTYLVKSDSYSTTLITVIYHDVSKDNIFVVDNNIGRMMFIKKIFFLEKHFTYMFKYLHNQLKEIIQFSARVLYIITEERPISGAQWQYYKGTK